MRERFFLLLEMLLCFPFQNIIREMNRLGMLIDLSHTSVHTMEDTLNITRAPVIFSHASAFTICNSNRNVPDHILKKVVS